MAENKADTKADEEVVGNMLKSRASSLSGKPYAELLAEEVPTPPLAETPPEVPDGLSLVYPATEALIAARPAELASSAAPVGLSERGWSPEVTSRDPRLVAEELEAMLAEMGGSSDADPVDPNDPAALATAQRDLGDLEARINALRTEAINRINNRLAAGIGKAGENSGATRNALEQAIEQAKASIGQFGEERSARQAHRETRRETRTTPPPTSTASTPPAPPARTRTSE